jgi:hypothetical protein
MRQILVMKPKQVLLLSNSNSKGNWGNYWVEEYSNFAPELQENIKSD